MMKKGQVKSFPTDKCDQKFVHWPKKSGNKGIQFVINHSSGLLDLSLLQSDLNLV